MTWGLIRNMLTLINKERGQCISASFMVVLFARLKNRPLYLPNNDVTKDDPYSMIYVRYMLHPRPHFFTLNSFEAVILSFPVGREFFVGGPLIVFQVFKVHLLP